MNFISRVRSLVDTLRNEGADNLNPKDDAVRRLGVAQEMTKLGEADKKRAKNALKGLGLIRDVYATGVEVAYDSNKFTLVATTKEPSATLKADCLTAALKRRGFGTQAIASIIFEATGTNKPATSFSVTQK